MVTYIWNITDPFIFDLLKSECLLFILCKYNSYTYLLKNDNIPINVVLYMEADCLTFALPQLRESRLENLKPSINFSLALED